MRDLLRRDMAPLSEAAWQELERQSKRILRGQLSGRRVVDFSGPHGWAFAAVNLGGLDLGPVDSVKGVGWGTRRVLPLVEIRVPFTLRIWDLDDLERGARNPDLRPLTEAARTVAGFEEQAVYWGFNRAAIQGLLGATSHAPVALSPDRSKLTESVELALLAIQEAEVGGPFALVLGTEPYQWLMAGDPAAYPLRTRIQALVTAGIYWSPALEGGAVLSQRGGDFELTVGQDLTIGYHGHTAQEVELYFTESFTFRVLDPAAVVELKLQPALGCSETCTTPESRVPETE